MLRAYDSLTEFLTVASTVKGRSYRDRTPDSWVGFTTYDQCLDTSKNGDEKLVPEAEKLLDKLDAEVDIERAQWVAAVSGAYVCVPDYLACVPMSMRRRKRVQSDVAPVRIYVSTTCSCSIDSKLMLKRGVAILALVLKLQQIRPVELNLLAETHGRTDGEYLQAIPIDSAPLNLSVACHCLTHVGFARHLTYGVASMKDGFNGSWPDSYGGGGAPWEAHVREVLSMEPQDLYIGAARDWDPMIQDPVKWVNAQVKAFTERN
jgi:hypothetical protein